jgi:alpha-glucosidase
MSAPWWQSAVIYQIYPRSFQDSDGDGIGDLKGIVRRIEHLVWLGVDAVWVCPFYPSPMVDFGYDIVDYCDVDPLFGTLADFDALVAALHAHGLRVILDFVPNHSSSRHPWFLDSRAARRSAKRDWYVWRDARSDGAPPSNWTDNTGHSAWEWDGATSQFYYHRFLVEQPDLNWRNPEVAEEMARVLRFWLARGVDGFRVDAATSLVEDDLLRDEPAAADCPDMRSRLLSRRAFTRDRPETHAAIAAMRGAMRDYPEAVLIGETHLRPARLVEYYDGKDDGFHLPFNFELIHTPWNARQVEAAIDRYMIELPRGACPNWVLGNHDVRRVASRIGLEQARTAAILVLTLEGTPFIYNGEELGLTDVPLDEGEHRDPAGTRGGRGRDAQRNPMPWDASHAGGFTTGAPWLALGEENRNRHAALQREEPHSMLNLYAALIRLRRDEPAFRSGKYLPCAERGDVLAYQRCGPGRRFHVALNLGPEEQRASLPANGKILISTVPDRDDRTGRQLTLSPHEGVVVELES